MSSTLFVAILIILVVLAPILILRRINRFELKKEEKLMLQEFDELRKDNHLTIEVIEKLGKRIIGLDKLNQKVLFLDKTKEATQIHLFDLRRLSFCEIVKTVARPERHIGTLAIQCSFKDPNHPSVYLTIFDIHFDNMADLSILEKRAECWKQNISTYKDHEMRRSVPNIH
jgi:hypothetical protein